MSKETIMHVHFAREEALQDKKDILRLQLNSIKILRKLKKYHELRMLELKIKSKIKVRVNKINADISKLNKIMPVPKIPQKFKKKEETKKEKTKANPEIKKDKLEIELQEIQKKLKEIDQKF